MKRRGLGQMWASIYNQTTNQVYMYPLGMYTTVFQAEVYAIYAYAKTLLMESEASIAICSDNQAALIALRSCGWDNESTERIVYVQHSVHLLWIPGHSDIPSNETGDQFAKQAASEDFVGPEPATKIRSAAQLWANAQQRKLWQTSSGCRQAKMFLHRPDKKLSRYALSLPRWELKILVGLLTGHMPYNT